MNTGTVIKNFDCIKFKDKVQARIYRKIKHMTPAEEIAYFRERARQGFFTFLFNNKRRKNKRAAPAF